MGGGENEERKGEGEEGSVEKGKDAGNERGKFGKGLRNKGGLEEGVGERE